MASTSYTKYGVGANIKTQHSHLHDFDAFNAGMC